MRLWLSTFSICSFCPWNSAPMAFYILNLLILALELVSLTFFLVFRLFSFTFRLFSIVLSFSIVKKGRRRYVPTPRGSLATLGPYRFCLLTRHHSRSLHQLHYHENLLHVFYAHRAHAGGPFSFPLRYVLRRASFLSHESKSKSATPFVCVPKKQIPMFICKLSCPMALGHG